MVLTALKIIGLYLALSICLSLIPVNNAVDETPKEKEIIIASNGVHTDIMLSIKTSDFDWKIFFDNQDLNKIWPYASHIAFGWGDKGFYLKTPNWSDLKPNTAFAALLMNSPSAMHVTLTGPPTESPRIIKVAVSNEQYARLERYILDSFSNTKNLRAIKIDFPGYGPYDFFYESDLNFNLFNTCNTWTNRALKKSGIKSAIWTPFDKPILYHLSNIPE